MDISPSFTTTFLVERSPEEVFSAINNVRGWWSEELEGHSENVGDEFEYHYHDVHRCKIRVIESVPGKKVVWHVLENQFSFTKDKTEWKDTKVVFEISPRGKESEVRFTHQGLVPEYECYDVCVTGWTSYIAESLKALIATGQGKPNARPVEGVEEPAVTDQSFTTSFTVDKTPGEAFAAINNVRGWWGGEIEGDAVRVGDEFSYRYKDLHFSRQKVTELVPGKKIVWRVVEANLTFTKDQAEWKGTDIVFDIAPQGSRTEIRFTHVGLVPGFECFNDCSSGWQFYVNGSLFRFISGKTSVQPVEALS